MPVFKDICRICLQEADYQEVQEINIQKLNCIKNKPFLYLPFVQKWETELFRNHQICHTCIDNFRTMKIVHRNNTRANTAIQSEKKQHQLSKVNLKRLKRFNHMEGDFVICRLCLEPTSQIAVYLYDSSKNILPMEYIEKMCKYAKIYTNFRNTINPILCHLCWKNLQITYSFGKHLEIVTEKIICYQVLAGKIYIDREDLQNLLNIWDQIDMVKIKTETPVNIKREVKKENVSELGDIKLNDTNLDKSARLKKSVADVKQEYSFYEEHNYFCMDQDFSEINKNKDQNNMWPLKKKTETTKTDIEECRTMPRLTSIIDNDKLKEMPKLKPNIETDIKTKTVSSRVLRSRSKLCVMIEKMNAEKLSLGLDNQQKQDVKSKLGKNKETLKYVKDQESKKSVENKLNETLKDPEKDERIRIIKKYEKAIETMQNKQEKELNSILYKEKLRNIRKYEEGTRPEKTKNKEQVNTVVKKRKMCQTLESKQEDQLRNLEGEELLKVILMESERPRTRLSTKKEIADDSFSKDLLVLKKEEIIKKKRQNRRLNIGVPKHTSTPKLSKNTDKQILSLTTVENLPSKSNSNTEYTFEILNLDDEIQVKKEVIEEEELQIKREVLSECDSDDNFTENTGCNANDIEDVDDECPNLESFIKSEPPEGSYVMDVDEEEGPPELEFQGPCQSVPISVPSFTIQNTYTVDEKRLLINTIDEKRNVLNLIDEKSTIMKTPVDDSRSTMNVTEDKNNPIIPSGLRRSSFNTMPERSLLKANNEKRLLINTIDEKRNVLNLIDKKSIIMKTPVDDSRSTMNVTEDKNNPIIPSGLRRSYFNIMPERSLLKANNEKSQQKPQLLKVKGGLLKKIVLEDCSESGKILNRVTAVTKCDNKTNPTLQKGLNIGNVTKATATLQKWINSENVAKTNPVSQKGLIPENVALQKTVQLKDVTKVTPTFVDQTPEYVVLQKGLNSKNVTKANPTLKKELMPEYVSKSNIAKTNPALQKGLNPENDAQGTRTLQKDLSSDKATVSNNVVVMSNSSPQNVNDPIAFHTNMHLLNIGPGKPFFCKLCDFSSESEKASKCHMALHISNSLFLHKCKICSFVSTRKAGVMEHMKNEHEEKTTIRELKPLCALCQKYVIYKQKACMVCNRIFHLKCYKLDRELLIFNCLHQHLTDVVTANRDVVLEEVQDDKNQKKSRCAFCNNCIGLKWINCRTCNKSFHYHCLPKDSLLITNNCSHKDLNKLVPFSTATRYQIARRKLQQMDCEYCAHPLTYKKVVSCMRCKRIMHLKCFQLDRVDKKFNCKHFAQRSSVTEDLISNIMKNAAVQDPQSTSKFCQIPTTSKEVKQEMLDESGVLNKVFV